MNQPLLTGVLNGLIIMLTTILVSLGAAIGVRAALGEPLLPWQSDPGDSCCRFPATKQTGSLAPAKQGGAIPQGIVDPFGFFAPHAEDDPGWNCLTQGTKSC